MKPIPVGHDDEKYGPLLISVFCFLAFHCLDYWKQNARCKKWSDVCRSCGEYSRKLDRSRHFRPVIAAR